MLTKEQVLGRPRRVPIKVPIPEWEGEVCIRVLSANEQLAMEPLLKGAEGDTARMLDVQLAAYLCNEDNSPWFASPDEASAMREKESDAVARIIKAGAKANGLDRETVSGNS